MEGDPAEAVLPCRIGISRCGSGNGNISGGTVCSPHNDRVGFGLRPIVTATFGWLTLRNMEKSKLETSSVSE